MAILPITSMDVPCRRSGMKGTEKCMAEDVGKCRDLKSASPNWAPGLDLAGSYRSCLGFHLHASLRLGKETPGNWLSRCEEWKALDYGTGRDILPEKLRHSSKVQKFITPNMGGKMMRWWLISTYKHLEDYSFSPPWNGFFKKSWKHLLWKQLSFALIIFFSPWILIGINWTALI